MAISNKLSSVYSANVHFRSACEWVENILFLPYFTPCDSITHKSYLLITAVSK